MLDADSRALFGKLRLEYGNDYNSGRKAKQFGGYTGSTHWENSQRWHETATTIIKRFAPESVLDVGCGRGTLVQEFRKQGVAAYGADIGEDIRTEWAAVGNAVELPFRDGFGCVLALDVVEHVPSDHQSALFSEFRRLLGEWLVVTVPVTTPYFTLGVEAGPRHHYLSQSVSGWTVHFMLQGFHVKHHGQSLEALGVPFNHGAGNYPFALQKRTYADA